MAREDLRTGAVPAPSTAANGTIDTQSGPAESKKLINEFLRKGHEIASRLEQHDLMPNDALELKGEKIHQELVRLEQLIEKGGDSKVISKHFLEVRKLIEDGQKAITPDTASRNPLGIREVQATKDCAAKFVLSVNRGEEIAFSYKRLCSDGSIGSVAYPQKFEGDTSGMTDPALGRIERHRDPNDPSKDIITIKAPHALKGYMTVHRGGEHTHLNVQNRQNNQHLWGSDGASLMDEASFANAANSITGAVRAQQPKAAPIVLPSEGTNLALGSETTINAGSEKIWFRYQGKVHSFDPGSTQSYRIGEVTFSRHGGQFKINVGDDAVAGPLDIRVGNQIRHLKIPEKPVADLKPENPELQTLNPTYQALPLVVGADTKIEIQRAGQNHMSVEPLQSGASAGIAIDRMKKPEVPADAAPSAEHFTNLAMLSVRFDDSTLQAGRYSIILRPPSGPVRHYLDFEVAAR